MIEIETVRRPRRAIKATGSIRAGVTFPNLDERLRFAEFTPCTSIERIRQVNHFFYHELDIPMFFLLPDMAYADRRRYPQTTLMRLSTLGRTAANMASWVEAYEIHDSRAKYVGDSLEIIGDYFRSIGSRGHPEADSLMPSAEVNDRG